MYNPVSTIRLQFHKEFTFHDFEKLIPFFSSLGIRTIYASPIFHAVPGSNHGYDVVDPFTINPEIGTIDQFERIIAELRKHGIGWIQDIVPNHMAFHPSNFILMDVLENGPESRYANYFDTSLASDFFEGGLMLPVLDGSLEDALAENEIRIVEDGDVFLEYGGNRYPLNKRSKALLQNGASINDVVNSQYYTFCDWRETDHKINYRRFFTVNSLICLNMQSNEVFKNYHSLISSFLKKGLIDGLRIDHIDGLLDPEVYLQRLRDLAGQDTYIIIEKILEPGEKLQQAWPVQGTSGYEFLATLNNIFTWTRAENKFSRFYNDIITNIKPFETRILEKKSLILFQSMAGELDNLTRYFIQQQLGPHDELLKNTIASFLIHCPWYRFYGNRFPLGKSEEEMVVDVLDDVRNDRSIPSKYTLLLEALIEKPEEENDDYNRRVTAFYQRLMQFTGPLMAKGVEDTLMYTFNRFVAHNEVGDSSEEFGTPAHSFHSTMMERQRDWPTALSATSTHDTKRGEDVRMRLNVLTDLPDEWIGLAKRWLSLDVTTAQEQIDASEKYFIYQTIIGSFPMDGNTTNFLSRLDDYFTKAFREAKRHTGWNDPDETFETSVSSYVHKLFEDARFMDDFLPFEKKVRDFGIINSLSQLILKMTCPGVPDIYQASIGWDLSLVDPDNRRAVDYDELKRALESETDLEMLWDTRIDGRIKVHLTRLLLNLRINYANMFAVADYIPLNSSGKNKENILSFAREYQDTLIVVIIPLHLARLVENADHVRLIDWGDTFIELPDETPFEWFNEIGSSRGSHEGQICLADVFDPLPIAVLRFQRKPSTRKAGILLPVTSLPSCMPVGDFGPAARTFADFLLRSGQKVWQMLPLNITDESVGFSPYSSYSSIAGNPLLISIEDLVKERLLDTSDLPRSTKRSPAAVDLAGASKWKEHLLGKSWDKFKTQMPISMTDEFNNFISDEDYWLKDFSLFEWIFREQGKPWFEWPVALRDREQETIHDIQRTHFDDLQKIKWIQFIFFRQVKALRKYCNVRGISLMGDLPFYVGYNSVDVWKNRNLFDIDEDGSITGSAGVPPDYFNNDGQLWGMPVYRWNKMKEDGYAWWIARIRKNIEIYDSLRLDHFRAFSNFWRVPKGETTAVNGTWMKGPGIDLFRALNKSLGKIEFIAEDLGDVDEEVFKLRDELSLPGMKVLQFAFGNDFPESIHLPHNHSKNFVVYTGTHDNNTSRGWYDKDVTEKERKNLMRYTGSGSIKKASHHLIRLAYASAADTAIIPIQDLLDLRESARMNTPSTTTGNWTWRLRFMPDEEIEEFLNELRRTYNR